jgi:hypothetical protein
MNKLPLRCAIVSVLVFGAIADAQPKPSIDQLSFMSGCWAFSSSDGRTEEYWTKPAGATMIGLSRVVAGGKTVFTEYTQIREDGGVLTMFVQLGLAKSTTAFRLTKLSAEEAVFTSDLEYPNRLIYRREKDGSLNARTEGTKGGKPQSEAFPYRRASCQ